MGEENTSEKLIPLEERWEEISEMISSYIDGLGARSKKPDNIEKILNLSYDELKSLGYEQCGEYSFILSQYAYFIQQEYNYHKSKVDWCELTLTYAVSNYGDQSTFMKKDEKAARLAFNNNAVKVIMKMMATAKTIMMNLEGLSFKISSMVDTTKYLQQSKRKLS